MDKMVISAAGLITSSGHDFMTAGGAIRAGIKRPQELVYFMVAGEDYFETEGLVGYPIINITDGFSTLGRWNVMGREAFRDFENNAAVCAATDFLPSETGYVFVSPYLSSPRYAFSGHLHDTTLVDEYCLPFLEYLGIKYEHTLVRSVQEDHTGIVHAVSLAEELFENGDVKRVIVIAADSLVDPDSLEWFAEKNRLKTDANPVGLIPGEAAAVLMLEPNGQTILSDMLTISRSCIHAVDGVDESGNERLCLAQTVSQLLGDDSFDGSLYMDMNGEAWRSMAYGIARSAIPEHQWVDHDFITPARCLGDTGAAGGAVSLCLMMHSVLRQYNDSFRFMLLASNDRNESAGLLIHSSEAVNREVSCGK